VSNAPPTIPPPPPYYPQQYRYAPAPVTNGLAVASLVFGILWIFGLGSLLAVILGHSAKVQIRKSNGAEGGSGLATAGLVLGWVGVVSLVLFVALVMVGIASNANSGA
jgi:hypothetical protein